MVSVRKRRARSKAMDQETMCAHYEQPIWMMVFGKKYQARCMGCGKVGPVVNDGPWAAQHACTG
jgi:hypothetical protein